jgi:hypothetical protein
VLKNLQKTTKDGSKSKNVKLKNSQQPNGKKRLKNGKNRSKVPKNRQK